MRKIILNAKAVLADRILQNAAIVIEDGIIRDIFEDAIISEPEAEIFDADGMLVMPGIIDIHSDAIEKEIEPRPETHFSTELALTQLERRLASQGITTVYHSLSFSGGSGVREDETAEAVINTIKDRPRSVIRHMVHARYEFTNFEALPIIRRLLVSGLVDLFSIMDHSPGQGQYRTLESYNRYLQKTYHLPEEEIARIVEMKIKRRENVGVEYLGQLVDMATALQIPVASHDDDDPDRIGWARKAGIRIAEFPISMEVAERAIQEGMYVLVGSPNVIRGGSHNGNLSALELIRNGYANIVCSDYYTGSMLPAVFKIAEAIGDLPKAVRMFTLNPAQAVENHGRAGSLAPGKNADLIMVDVKGSVPVVNATIVNGNSVYACGYWQEKLLSRQRVS